MERRTGRILIVDDEEELLSLSSNILSREGHTVITTSSARGALRLLKKQQYDVVLLDLKMPDMDGIAFLEQYGSYPHRAEVVVLTAYAAVGTAVRAMKLGAHGYISKPFNAEEVLAEIDRILELRDLRRENQVLRRRQGQLDRLVGRHESMQRIQRLIEEVAPTDMPVLIQGPTGTGKELIARAVHFSSKRADRAMISCNCESFAHGVLESELFGHVKGAFTGALKDRKGRFDEADGGTLFLDEIGDLALETQIRLLRVLQEKEFEPVGSNTTRTADVRIITATNRNLETEVRESRFREDLYYRINAVTIEVPPLRSRLTDLPLLCSHFLRRLSASMDKSVHGFTPAAMVRLEMHDWPGNVRELENVLMRAVAMSKTDEIDATDIKIGGGVSGAAAREALPEEVFEVSAPFFHDARDRFEQIFIERALCKTRGNITKASELIKLGRRNLQRKIQEYGIDVQDFRFRIDHD